MYIFVSKPYIWESKIPYYKTGTPKVHLFPNIYVKLQICQYMNFDQAANRFHNFLSNKYRDIWFVAF